MPKNSFRSERRAARAAKRRNQRILIGAVVVLAIALIGGYIAFTALTANQDLACKPGDGEVVTLDSGLKYEDITICGGTEAQAGDSVNVHYTGYLQSGEEFDSSRDGEPFTFTIGAGSVIDGWDQGIPGMTVGTIRKLTVPPELAYGTEDYGPIPGNSTLIFEVELVEIQGQQ